MPLLSPANLPVNGWVAADEEDENQCQGWEESPNYVYDKSISFLKMIVICSGGSGTCPWHHE